MMRAFLILNPNARRGAAEAQIRAALANAGVSVVDNPDDADCLVAAGGDGTVLSAIDDAIARKIPAGIVPLGTFNELARTLAIPLDMDGAARAIAGGRTRTIDVGRVNGVAFVNEASIGVSSRVARLQTADLKRRFGIFAILATALRAFGFARPLHAEIHYDGSVERVKTIQLTIANSHRFGGIVNRSDAAIDDGWLDLYCVDTSQPMPRLRVLRSTRFEIHTPHAHHITADGEPAGMTPATFEVVPGALRVLIPS